jgi:hypothetical protein
MAKFVLTYDNVTREDQEYWKNYFSDIKTYTTVTTTEDVTTSGTTISGVTISGTFTPGTTITGTYTVNESDWINDIVSVSGIQMMIEDLGMLTKGLNYNLDVEELFTTTSGLTYEEIKALSPSDTDTNELYRMMDYWNTEQNTTYSNYLFGKMTEVLIKHQPTLKLKLWFGLTDDNADILWNLLNIYRDQEQNMDSAYLNAVLNIRDAFIYSPSNNI